MALAPASRSAPFDLENALLSQLAAALGQGERMIATIVQARCKIAARCRAIITRYPLSASPRTERRLPPHLYHLDYYVLTSTGACRNPSIMAVLACRVNSVPPPLNEPRCPSRVVDASTPGTFTAQPKERLRRNQAAVQRAVVDDFPSSLLLKPSTTESKALHVGGMR